MGFGAAGSRQEDACQDGDSFHGRINVCGLRTGSFPETVQDGGRGTGSGECSLVVGVPGAGLGAAAVPGQGGKVRIEGGFPVPVHFGFPVEHALAGRDLAGLGQEGGEDGRRIALLRLHAHLRHDDRDFESIGQVRDILQGILVDLGGRKDGLLPADPELALVMRIMGKGDGVELAALALEIGEPPGIGRGIEGVVQVRHHQGGRIDRLRGGVSGVEEFHETLELLSFVVVIQLAGRIDHPSPGLVPDLDPVDRHARRLQGLENFPGMGGDQGGHLVGIGLVLFPGRRGLLPGRVGEEIAIMEVDH